MEAKLEKYLFKKYPELFKDHSKPMTETCMCWGCSCGNGWLLLIDRLCAEITNHITNQHRNVEWYKKMDKQDAKEGNPIHPRPEWAKEKISQVTFTQVKEKFGALRVYHSGGDEKISAMIDFAEGLSKFVCEDCGKFDLTGGATTKFWIHSQCEECSKNDEHGDRGWKQYSENKEAMKVFKAAMKDKEKNKKKPFKAAVEKMEEVRKRSKTKETWGTGKHDHGVE
jgi:hypothetical protein